MHEALHDVEVRCREAEEAAERKGRQVQDLQERLIDMEEEALHARSAATETQRLTEENTLLANQLRQMEVNVQVGICFFAHLQRQGAEWLLKGNCRLAYRTNSAGPAGPDEHPGPGPQQQQAAHPVPPPAEAGTGGDAARVHAAVAGAIPPGTVHPVG